MDREGAAEAMRIVMRQASTLERDPEYSTDAIGCLPKLWLHPDARLRQPTWLHFWRSANVKLTKLNLKNGGGGESYYCLLGARDKVASDTITRPSRLSQSFTWFNRSLSPIPGGEPLGKDCANGLPRCIELSRGRSNRRWSLGSGYQRRCEIREGREKLQPSYFDPEPARLVVTIWRKLTAVLF
jgi:hypothetical protein